MNEIDLYKLPKDVLVKLITTIQEQTKEEIIEDFKEQCSEEGKVYECMDCDNFCIYDGLYGRKLYKYKKISLYDCNSCQDRYCENHKDKLVKYQEMNGARRILQLCEECTKGYIEQGKELSELFETDL